MHFHYGIARLCLRVSISMMEKHGNSIPSISSTTENYGMIRKIGYDGKKCQSHQGVFVRDSS
jgi:hypothetical protein